MKFTHYDAAGATVTIDTKFTREVFATRGADGLTWREGETFTVDNRKFGVYRAGRGVWYCVTLETGLSLTRSGSTRALALHIAFTTLANKPDCFELDMYRRAVDEFAALYPEFAAANDKPALTVRERKMDAAKTRKGRYNVYRPAPRSPLFNKEFTVQNVDGYALDVNGHDLIIARSENGHCWQVYDAASGLRVPGAFASTKAGAIDTVTADLVSKLMGVYETSYYSEQCAKFAALIADAGNNCPRAA